jgi:hypothetical protein
LRNSPVIVSVLPKPLTLMESGSMSSRRIEAM